MQDPTSDPRPDTGAPPPVAVVEVDPLHPDPGAVDSAAAALLDGRLVAFPTETVYGLGAAIGRPDAVRRIFAAKGRPASDPLIVHVEGVAALGGIVAEVPGRARDLADAFWPGPLTLVLPRGSLVGDDITAGGGAVAVRVPAHPVAERLLRSAGTGVAAPSANRFGHVSPTDAAHVLDDLGGHLEPADVVIDAGPTPLGIESTVVDLTSETPVVLRHGGVTVEDLCEVLGEVAAPERRSVAEGESTASPGALLRHYAPQRPLALVEGDVSTAAALREALGSHGVRTVVVELPADPRDAAASLYRRLRAADGRDADGRDVDLLLAVACAPSGLGRAVNDRLYRAAHGRVVIDDSSGTVDRLVAAARG